MGNPTKPRRIFKIMSGWVYYRCECRHQWSIKSRDIHNSPPKKCEACESFANKYMTEPMPSWSEGLRYE